MPRRKSGRAGFPYDATPDVHHFPGVPRSSFDLVNMYGTYNIQPTSDTENAYPAIAAGVVRHPEDVPTPRRIMEENEK